MDPIYRYFAEGDHSRTKHDLLVESITEAIAAKRLRTGHSLPSVNDFIRELSLSRMTILKALNELKDRGIIEARNRVGYFVRNEDVDQQLKVMLVLTAFSSYHEILYNAFMDELKGSNIIVDLFFHHGNARLLRSVMNENIGHYGMYVITPISDPELVRIMDAIPESKLLQIVRPVCSNNNISYISQDFYQEVINALDTVGDRIAAYDEFILVFPGESFHSTDIRKAFTAFCGKRRIRCSVQEEIDTAQVRKNCAYFVIEESHLISLIKAADQQGLKLGSDLGILSYNDTPMKEIIRQGITVISIDFAKLGRMAARYVLDREALKEVIPTTITLRKSL